ncbi:hypothetical protein FRC17_010416, partial [Serendipita sp. 399]
VLLRSTPPVCAASAPSVLTEVFYGERRSPFLVYLTDELKVVVVSRTQSYFSCVVIFSLAAIDAEPHDYLKS